MMDTVIVIKDKEEGTTATVKFVVAFAKATTDSTETVAAPVDCVIALPAYTAGSTPWTAGSCNVNIS